MVFDKCRCESGTAIALADLDNAFSLDKSGKRYRVEVYRGRRFAGMVLVDFSADTARSRPPSFGQVPPMRIVAYHQAIVQDNSIPAQAAEDADGL